MNALAPLALALLGFALSALTLALLLPWLRRALLDQPNARSSHQQPTPRGGGLAFVLVGSALSLVQGFWLPLLCTPLAAVGLVDDRLQLSARLRYGVQLVTAAALVASSPLLWRQGPWAWLLWLALLLGVTAMINLVNFMDGLDGLVASCMAITLAVAAVQGVPQLWPLCGAIAGFLCWNWSPARVFMGDVGSTFLGAVLAGVMLQAHEPRQAAALLLVALPLLGDATTCVLRRAWHRQPVWQAHRLHLYQRLHQAGWSHGRVSTLYAAATAALAAVALSQVWPLQLGAAAGVLLLGFWLDQRCAVPFAARPMAR